MSRMLLAGLVAALLAPPLAAAAPARAQGGPVVLRAAITKGVDTLNPFLAEEYAATELGRLNYEYLTTYSAKDFGPSPGLAERWRENPDGSWTFTLRENARWSDGAPITAADVVYTVTQLLTNESARAVNGSYVDNVRAVRANGPHEVVLETKKPQATMLGIDVPIVPQHVWSKLPDLAKVANDSAVVGSGPFVLTEYKAQQYATLKANEHFWRGRPKIDELRFVFFQNTDAAVQALRRGDIDLIGDGVNSSLTPAQFGALRDEPGITVNRGLGQRIYQLVLNPGARSRSGTPLGDGHPALADLRVRQAIGHAIDTRALVDRVLDGLGTPATGYLPPAFPAVHWSPPEQDRRGFDQGKANRLLDEAGYPRGQDGLRRDSGGKPLTLRLSGRQDRATDTKVGAFVKEWLQAVGITVEPRIVAGREHNQLTSTGRFDLAFSGWGVGPEPNYVLSVQTCAARPGQAGNDGTTDGFFCDPEYDRLYAAQLSETDRPQRLELIRKLQQRWHELAPAIPLYHADALEAYRGDRFQGLQTQPDPNGQIGGQSGYWGYYGATPRATGSAAQGLSAPVRIAIAVAVVLLVAGVALLVRRRRAVTADARE